MAAINLWIKNLAASGSSHGQLVDVDPNTNVTTGTGWTTDTATGYSLQIWNTKRASSTFGATALPNAAPSTSDCWRSVNTYSGTIAAGAWTLACIFSSVAGSGVTIAGRFRVWRSANADGSSATEITSGAVEGNAVTVDSGNNISTVTTGSLGSVTLTNEYIFLQIAAHITVAGAATSDALLSYWTTALGAKNVITPNFAPSSTLAGDEDFYNPTFGLPGRSGVLEQSPRTDTQQLVFEDDAPAGSLVGMSADDPNDSWYGSTYLPGIARSSKAAVAASLLALVATSLPLQVSADEQIPAGNLTACPDDLEEEPPWWPPAAPRPRGIYLPDPDDGTPQAAANAVDDEGVPVWPPWKPPSARAAYQPDADDVPAGSFFTLDEDYNQLALTGPPWSQPWRVALEWPYEPDLEELPAGALFGVPEDDAWAARVSRSTSAPSLYLPDADDAAAAPAPSIVEDDVAPAWTPRASAGTRAAYQPDPDDLAGAFYGEPDEDFDPLEWTGPPTPQAWRATQPLPYAPDVEEILAGTLLGQPEEDYSAVQRAQPWRTAVALPYQPDADDLPAGALYGVPEEDSWSPPPAPRQPARAVYLPDGDDVQPAAGAASAPPDDDAWQPQGPPPLRARSLYLPDVTDTLSSCCEDEAWPQPATVVAREPALYLPDPTDALPTCIEDDGGSLAQRARPTANAALYLPDDGDWPSGLAAPPIVNDDYTPSLARPPSPSLPLYAPDTDDVIASSRPGRIRISDHATARAALDDVRWQTVTLVDTSLPPAEVVLGDAALGSANLSDHATAAIDITDHQEP
jgi:hypothetical protein